jgi:hypothetical protein
MPERASEFVQTIISSDARTNTTQVFLIYKNNEREKIGNVTFFVEISAFNQNYTVFK